MNPYWEGHPCHNFIKSLSVRAPEYVLRHEDVMAQVGETDRVSMKCNALNIALRNLEVENARLKLRLKRREVEDEETSVLLEEARRRRKPDVTPGAELLALRKSELEALELQLRASEERLAVSEREFEDVRKWREGLTRTTQQTTTAQ